MSFRFGRQCAAVTGPGASLNRTRIWRWLLALTGLVLIAAAAAYYLLAPEREAAVRPRLGPAIIAVYASGSVEASVMLPVAPRVGGRLVALDNDEHAVVRRGQLLGRLESADLANQIVQLSAAAEFARIDFQRDERLMRESAIARQVYERARSDWQAAEAAVRQAQAQAGYMYLRAPDNCNVIQRDGEIGQYIAANQPVFWLSCQAQLRISALVDEEDIALVRPGQKVLIRADAFPNQIFEAKVTEVTPKGDPIGRSYRVRIGLPPGNPLRIGMTTESNIIIKRNEHAMLLPATAVNNGQVWTVRDGIARRTAVVTGTRSNDSIEIVHGLDWHDVVLRDGTMAAPARRIVPRFDPP